MLRQLDKQAHFAVSALLIHWLYLLTKSMTIAISVTVIIGLAKEAYDQWSYQGGDVNDMFANCLGISIAVLAEVLLRS